MTTETSRKDMPFRPIAHLLLAIGLSVGLTGCFGFLKPAKSNARHYVLTPLPSPTNGAPTGKLAVGLGPVKVPSYLFNSSLAIRRGANEVDYSSPSFWAERLDTGLQRVLAANLATLLPSDQIRISSWETADVAVEVYVTVDRFDVDAKGQGNLVAWWRIMTPGGTKILKAGESRLSLSGPSPDTDPSGAVATLSSLAADLSRQLAEATKQAAASPAR